MGIKRYILFHGKRRPQEMGEAEVTACLSALAVEGNVAAATQHQALSAVLFLYREVLQADLPWMSEIVRGKSLPDSDGAFAGRGGTQGLMARLLYGTGMRLMECVRLRVKDVEFDRREIRVRDGKGGKDRVTMLPSVMMEPLRRVCLIWEADAEGANAGVWLPDALERKCSLAGGEWGDYPRASARVGRLVRREKWPGREKVALREGDLQPWEAALRKAPCFRLSGCPECKSSVP